MKGFVPPLLRTFFLSCLQYVLLFAHCQGQVTQINQVKQQLLSLKDSNAYTDALINLSKLYATRSLDSSLYFALMAKDIAERRAYTKGLAAAYNSYGFYYLEKANLYLAYKFANEALDLYRSIRDKDGECELLMNVGVISMRENKPQQASAYFDEAYQLKDLLKSDSLLSILLINKAQMNVNHLQWPEIKYIFDQAEGIAKKYGDWQSLLNIDLAKAGMLQFKGLSLVDAHALQKRALLKAAGEGANYFSAWSYYALGDGFQHAQQTDSADRYYLNGAQYAKAGDFDNLYVLGLGRALDNVKGKPAYRDKTNQYSTIILEAGRKKFMDEQKDGLNLLQVSIKEKDLELAAVNSKIKNTWIVLLITATSFTLLFLFFLYRSYKQKRTFTMEQRQLIAELEMKNKVLEENNEFNKNLISVMAHDLRQPFSSIIMLDRTAAKDVMGKEQYIALMEKMRITSEKSIQVMDGLLQWMKLQLLGLGYHASPINLLANINEALSFNADMLTQKKIAVHNLIDSGILIDAQQEMLLFINRNIINNAIKYSPRNGEIVLKAQKLNQTVHVSIRDSGSGIPPDAMRELFTSDHGKNAGKTPVKGAGIALYICSDMIAKMGGRIWAENSPDGKGAIFNYSLPTTNGQTIANPPLNMNAANSLN